MELRDLTFIAAATITMLVASPARTEPLPAPNASVIDDGAQSHVYVDLEVDPTAYLMSGYSLHVGVGWTHFRLDLGVYGMDIPSFAHGNPGWDVTFDGAGAKLQWFPLAEQRGLFVDISGGLARQRVTLAASGASHRDTDLAAGASAGWRFMLPRGFYASPWAGLNYTFDGADVMLDGERFKTTRLVPFAAVHLGVRFR
jgi:hypothetical protein